LIIVDERGKMDVMGFFNYYNKAYNDALLFSGDVTSPTGTEYYDMDLNALRRAGVRYVIQAFHGYCSNLNSGEIYCGYQDKKNLNTKAWDPKNIELKIHVKGDTRAFISFAVDLEKMEVVILNMLVDSESRVVSTDLRPIVDKYLSDACLELNMGLVASWRGTEVVDRPEDANVVFDDAYVADAYEGQPAEEVQKVIRSWDLEKLVSLASGASL